MAMASTIVGGTSGAEQEVDANKNAHVITPGYTAAGAKAGKTHATRLLTSQGQELFHCLGERGHGLTAIIWPPWPSKVMGIKSLKGS